MKRKRQAQEVVGSQPSSDAKSSTSRAARGRADEAVVPVEEALPAEAPRKKRRREAAEQEEVDSAPAAAPAKKASSEACVPAAGGEPKEQRTKKQKKMMKKMRKQQHNDVAKGTAATAENDATEAVVAKVAAANPAVQESLTVYLEGFPCDTHKAQLYLDFGGGGKIAKLVIPKDEEEREARELLGGAAFITFKKKADVDAICKLDGTEYAGRTIEVHRVARKEEAGHEGGGNAAKGLSSFEHEVSVRGLPPTTTAEQLRGHFEACGEFVNLKLLHNEKGAVRGTAFIAFKDEDALKKAVELDGAEFGGRAIYVCRPGDFGSKGTGRRYRAKFGKGKGKSKGEEHGKGNAAPFLGRGGGRGGGSPAPFLGRGGGRGGGSQAPFLGRGGGSKA